MPPLAPAARGTALVLIAAALTTAVVATPLAATASSHIVAADADAPTGSSFSVPAGSLIAGAPVTIAYKTDVADAKNWIGFYREGEAPGAPGQFSASWTYAPSSEGSITIPVPSSAGTYTVWFLAKDGYEPLADKLTVTVAAAPDALTPGDPTAAVTIDPVVTTIDTDGVLMREDFGASLPDGWTVDQSPSARADTSTAYGSWVPTTRAAWTENIDEMRARFARPLGEFLVADAQQAGGGAYSSTVTSAPVDVQYLRSLQLTFDSHYRGAPDQSGVVRVSFDGQDWVELLRLDSSTVTDRYDPLQLNYSQTLTAQVPEGASQVRFQWQLDAAGPVSRYWAIDSVTVRQGEIVPTTSPTQLWTVSDIQGHPADFEHGLNDLHALAPNPAGLLIVGDLVNSGTTAEWNQIYQVMDNTVAIRPAVTVASIGNHERYASGGFAANFARFLAFAERDKAYHEYVLTGPGGEIPVITIGQEMSGPSDVPMTDAQVEFLEERLAAWTARGSQIIVNTHFPLGDTVSASWIPWYHDHHLMNDRLTSILGKYPNVVVFSGHTHYPASLGDWAVQRRTVDGHPDGFWAVNTVAMHVGWEARGENTAGISEVTTGDVNNGLLVESYGDRIVVKAYDFASDQLLREVTIRNPLAPFVADVVPAAERPADYAAVDAELSRVPTDVSRYTAESADALNRALAGVVRGLRAGNQSDVDAMAVALRGAIDALVLRTSSPADVPGMPANTPGKDGAVKSRQPSTEGELAESGSQVDATWLAALGLAVLGGAMMVASRRRRGNAADHS